MSATTVKLDSVLLEELRRIKPANQTLTALVRELLEAEIRRRRMIRAATEYTAFLEQNPDEASELELWASSPLERDAAGRRKKRR
jgi:hypothetical protein